MFFKRIFLSVLLCGTMAFADGDNAPIIEKTPNMIKKSPKKHIAKASVTSALIDEPVNTSMIELDTDFLKPIRLTQPAGNLVISNPFIADVIPRDDKYLFLTGKSAGKTNLLIYDKENHLVSQYMIYVRTSEKYTKVQNGSKNVAHYQCLPRCERVVRLEDSTDAAAEQTGKIQNIRSTVNGAAAQGASVDAVVSKMNTPDKKTDGNNPNAVPTQ